MLRALGVLLFVAFSTVVSPALAQTWIAFKPEGVGYSLEMPGEWTLSSENINTAIGPLKANMAAVTVADRAFMTMWIAYPEDVVRSRPVGTMLDGARDGAVANVKGTLRKEDRITVNNLPAREIIIDAPNNLVVIARYFLLRNILVQALTAGARGAEVAADTRRFLNSLKVVSP
jgi:hypothetical protein